MITDIIIVIFVIILAVLGYKRGLILNLINLITTVVSLLIAWFLIGPLTRVLEKAPFLAPLADQMEARLTRPLLESGESIAKAISGFGLPAAVEDLLLTRFPEADSGLNDAWQELSAMLFRFALSAGIFLIVLSLIFILMFFLGRALTKTLDKLPLLGSVNRLAGLLVNLLLSLFIIHAVLFAAALLAPLSDKISHWLNSSVILSWFYKSEVWLGLLDTIFS